SLRSLATPAQGVAGVRARSPTVGGPDHAARGLGLFLLYAHLPLWIGPPGARHALPASDGGDELSHLVPGGPLEPDHYQPRIAHLHPASHLAGGGGYRVA